ncbi:hypothetical protein C5167_031176 [Papaver somniferum]|nr:hypothetical protein C5167_031176 [Papaver somniferum]
MSSKNYLIHKNLRFKRLNLSQSVSNTCYLPKRVLSHSKLGSTANASPATVAATFVKFTVSSGMELRELGYAQSKFTGFSQGVDPAHFHQEHNFLKQDAS